MSLLLCANLHSELSTEFGNEYMETILAVITWQMQVEVRPKDGKLLFSFIALPGSLIKCDHPIVPFGFLVIFNQGGPDGDRWIDLGLVLKCRSNKDLLYFASDNFMLCHSLVGH